MGELIFCNSYYLQEELKSVERIQPASRSCKEYVINLVNTLDTFTTYSCGRKLVFHTQTLLSEIKYFLELSILQPNLRMIGLDNWQGHWFCGGKFWSFSNYVRTLQLTFSLEFMVNIYYLHKFHFHTCRNRKIRRSCRFWKWLWYALVVLFYFYGDTCICVLVLRWYSICLVLITEYLIAWLQD